MNYSRHAPLVLSLLVSLAFPRSAHAMQPLSDFIRSARAHNLDVRESTAQEKTRSAEASMATLKLLPTFTARGTYTYNQFEAIVRQGATATTAAREAIVTPQNQLDGYLTIDLPLVDVPAWSRVSSANRSAEAASARRELTWLEAEKAVVRGYAQVVATRAIVDASRRQLAVNEETLKNIRARKSAELATELDVARANAEVERAKQVLAAAEYNAKVQARLLQTQSGLAPTDGVASLHDDLANEAPLAQFGQASGPYVRAPELERDAASATERERRWTLAPTLAASGTQRFTNATGFAGQSATFAAQVNLVWKLDAASFAQTSAATHQSEALQAKADRARQAWEDDLANTYDLVQTNIATLRSARAELLADQEAASVAHAKYKAGTLLQLDLLDAERRAFAAEVSVLQAEADLFTARAHLRILANMPIGGEGPR